MNFMSQLHTPPLLLVETARRELAGQLDKAISGKLEILKFWSMVTVLQEAAERGVYSQLENKPPLSVPIVEKSQGGRPLQPTDLKSIFTGCGIVPEKWKTAYRLHADGEAMAAHYEAQVGKRFATAMPLTALMNTPDAELPEAARKKQQLFFEFVASEHGGAAKKDLRTHNPGGFRPNLRILRAWLEEEYPERAVELMESVLNGSFSDLPEDIQKHFKAEAKRYEERLTKEQKAEMERAEDGLAWCEQITPAVTLGIDHEYYHYAGDEQLAALVTALTDLKGFVEQAQAARDGKRPATMKALPRKDLAK